jgi:hypothetical protein
VTPAAASAPGAPTGVTAEPDTTSARVAWTPPADDGGSAITGYRITPYVGATAGTPVTAGASARTAHVTGLTNGTSYTFRVEAVNATGAGTASAATGAVVPKHSLFEFATPTTVDANDGNAIQLGVKFRSSVAGSVTGIRFYKAAANTGTHVATLWNEAGAVQRQATFSGESASGWQKVTFATPFPIAADTTYVAGYHAPNGHYSVTGAAFAGGPFSNPPLSALANTVSSNGVYRYSSTPAFPTSTYNAANYWVDVLFEAGA